MAKDDEIEYLSRLGEAGIEHALNKPWSDAKRGLYLQEMGGFLSLMPAPPARVLDLGAGSGWTSCLLAIAGYSVTASDIAPGMVELQRINSERYGVSLDDRIVCDFEHLPFEDEFDVVIFYDCLHHSEDEVAALGGAYRALKPGGVCITLEPGRGHHKMEASRAATESMGTTERDMPPRLIIAAGRKVGFARHAIHDRPSAPTMITSGLWPRPRAIVDFMKRFVVRATPLATTRGHFVVLTK